MNSIKQIEVIYNNRLVGRLALTREGLCAFEYSAEWLSSGFSISPFELPLRSGVSVSYTHLRAHETVLDSVFSMIACPMDGDFLFWTDTCNKRESILAHSLYWIVLPWWDRQDAEHWSFVLIIA